MLTWCLVFQRCIITQNGYLFNSALLSLAEYRVGPMIKELWYLWENFQSQKKVQIIQKKVFVEPLVPTAISLTSKVSENLRDRSNQVAKNMTMLHLPINKRARGSSARNHMRRTQNCQSAVNVNHGKDEDAIFIEQWRTADCCKTTRHLSVAVAAEHRTVLNTKWSNHNVWGATSMQYFLFPCSACSFDTLVFSFISAFVGWLRWTLFLTERYGIHSVALHRTRNLSIERRTLCHCTVPNPIRF